MRRKGSRVRLDSWRRCWISCCRRSKHCICSSRCSSRVEHSL